MLYFEGFKNPGANTDLSPKPWERHYALLPKNINGERVWLKHYYSRYAWTEYEVNNGLTDYILTKQYGTFIDVLRSEV